MHALGFDRVAAVGHDRGARVVHRLCLDAPEAVTRAAVLDVVPTRHVFGHADLALGLAYYHWYFLAQPPGLPERLIGQDAEFWLRHHLARWSGGFDFADPAVAEYVRCFAEPAAIAASCEDYRAAATIDLEHDEASYAAGDRVRCPLLALWGARGFVGGAYDVLAVWRDYAGDVRGAALDCGHFVPEEQPGPTIEALRDFLG
jgi:haloacetate dehalogenase